MQFGRGERNVRLGRNTVRAKVGAGSLPLLCSQGLEGIG